MEKLSIVIPAHDSHKDVVLLFYQCFKKFWHDCPYRLYWTNCEEELKNNRIETIHNGNDTFFAKRLLAALYKVKTEYVLLWVEDFLPTKEIYTYDIEKVLEYMDEHKSNYCCLLKSSKNLMRKDTERPYIYRIMNNRPYGVSINCGIFRWKYLMELIENEKWNVWELEINMLKLAADGELKGCIYLDGGIGDLVNFLFKGKIDPIALKKLGMVGVDTSHIVRDKLSVFQAARIRIITVCGELCPVRLRKAVKRLAARVGISIASEF